jgi:hypothetical protein
VRLRKGYYLPIPNVGPWRHSVLSSCGEGGYRNVNNVNKQLPYLITKLAKHHSITTISNFFLNTNVSHHPSIISTHIPPQSPHCIASLQTNLVSIKGFVHEVLHRLCTSGSILLMAPCYLVAICSKVPKVVRKEKMGLGVQVKYL